MLDRAELERISAALDGLREAQLDLMGEQFAADGRDRS